MKITFLAPTLEPTKDGVADYTFQLAAECQRLGHAVDAIGFHDAHVGSATRLDSPVRTLRVPQSMPWRERLAEIRSFRSSNPFECVSLQVVPYAFHPKGLMFGWARALEDLLSGARLQVMLHEIWLGLSKNSPWRHRLIGPAQRHFQLQVLSRLRPSVVHTSNAAYAEALRRSGIDAEILPLCGNVSIEPKREDFEPVAALGERNCFWLIGFFGSVHPEWQPEPFLTRMGEIAESQGKRLIFVHVGRIGPGEPVWTSTASRYKNAAQFERVGEQPPAVVSQWMQHFDFGVATSPLEILGKSGTYATMREHGLPVIVTRAGAEFRFPVELPELDGVIQLGPEFRSQILAARKQSPRSRLAEVAQQFIESFR